MIIESYRIEKEPTVRMAHFTNEESKPRRATARARARARSPDFSHDQENGQWATSKNLGLCPFFQNKLAFYYSRLSSVGV